MALNFNVCVTHSREILHTTGAHPATRNDKTLARLDPFFTKLRMGKLQAGDGLNVSQVSYDLRTADGEGHTEQGPYIITDNGYLHWPMLQFAPKYSSDQAWLRWAKRLESVRKDSECTYGILKQRFRELRLPSEFKKAITVERVFKTCCQLHNRLLRLDGLSTLGHYEGDWDLKDADEDERAEERKKLDALSYRYKHVRPDFDGSVNESKPEEVQKWAARRQRLVEHFNQLKSDEMQWLATAETSRYRPHLQVGFTGDSFTDEQGGDESDGISHHEAEEDA